MTLLKRWLRALMKVTSILWTSNQVQKTSTAMKITLLSIMLYFQEPWAFSRAEEVSIQWPSVMETRRGCWVCCTSLRGNHNNNNVQGQQHVYRVRQCDILLLLQRRSQELSTGPGIVLGEDCPGSYLSSHCNRLIKHEINWQQQSFIFILLTWCCKSI